MDRASTGKADVEDGELGEMLGSDSYGSEVGGGRNLLTKTSTYGRIGNKRKGLKSRRNMMHRKLLTRNRGRERDGDEPLGIFCDIIPESINGVITLT
jgi:hypothetical protein